MGFGQLINGAVDRAKDAATAGWDATVDAAADIKQAVVERVDGTSKAEPTPTPAGVNLPKPTSQSQASHVGAKPQASAKTTTTPQPQHQAQSQTRQQVQAQVDTRITQVEDFAQQYKQHVSTKGDLQNLGDTVREKVTGHRDHQFRNIDTTLEGLVGLQQRLADGRIDAPAARAELDAIFQRYERTKSDVAKAQIGNAGLGATLRREVRNGVVGLAGLLTKPFGGGAPAGVAAGSAFDAVTEVTNELGTARVTQLAAEKIVRSAGNVQVGLAIAGVQAIREYRQSVQNPPAAASREDALPPIAPKLDTSGSLGGVLVRVAGGRTVSGQQWRDGVFGSAGDAVNGAAAGLGMKSAQNAQRALVLKSAGQAPRRHALALAAAQATAKISAAQNVAHVGLDTANTLTGPATDDGRTRVQKASQDLRSRAAHLPMDVAAGSVNSYLGVAAQIDHVLDVPLQYALDTAGNLLPRWIDDGQLSGDDLTSGLVGGVQGAVQNVSQRLPQAKAHTAREAPHSQAEDSVEATDRAPPRIQQTQHEQDIKAGDVGAPASQAAEGADVLAQSTQNEVSEASDTQVEARPGSTDQAPDAQDIEAGDVEAPAPQATEGADVLAQSTQNEVSEVNDAQVEAPPGPSDQAPDAPVTADPVAAQEAQARLEQVLAAQLGLAGQEVPSSQQAVPGAAGRWQDMLRQRQGHTPQPDKPLHERTREHQLSMALDDRFAQGQDISWMSKQDAMAHARSRPADETFVWRDAGTETEVWLRGEQPARSGESGNRFTSGEDLSSMSKQDAMAYARSRPADETFVWRDAGTETELWLRGEQPESAGDRFAAQTAVAGLPHNGDSAPLLAQEAGRPHPDDSPPLPTQRATDNDEAMPSQPGSGGIAAVSAKLLRRVAIGIQANGGRVFDNIPAATERALNRIDPKPRAGDASGEAPHSRLPGAAASSTNNLARFGESLRKLAEAPGSALAGLHSKAVGAARNLYYLNRQEALLKETDLLAKKVGALDSHYQTAEQRLSIDTSQVEHWVVAARRYEAQASALRSSHPTRAAEYSSRAQDLASIAEQKVLHGLGELGTPRFAKTLDQLEGQLTKLQAKVVEADLELRGTQSASNDSREVMVARQRYQQSVDRLDKFLDAKTGAYVQDPVVRGAVGAGKPDRLPGDRQSSSTKLRDSIEELRQLNQTADALPKPMSYAEYRAASAASGQTPSIAGYLASCADALRAIRGQLTERLDATREFSASEMRKNAAKVHKASLDAAATKAPNALGVGQAGVEYSAMKKLNKNELSAALKTDDIRKASAAVDVMQAVKAQAEAEGRASLAADAGQQLEVLQRKLDLARRSTDLGSARQVISKAAACAERADAAAVRVAKSFQRETQHAEPRIAALQRELLAAEQELRAASPARAAEILQHVEVVDRKLDALEQRVSDANVGAIRAIEIADHARSVLETMQRRVNAAESLAGLTPTKLIVKPIA